MPIQDIGWKSSRERWTIESGGERRSERSKLAVWHDDEEVWPSNAKFCFSNHGFVNSLIGFIYFYICATDPQPIKKRVLCFFVTKTIWRKYLEIYVGLTWPAYWSDLVFPTDYERVVCWRKHDLFWPGHRLLSHQSSLLKHHVSPPTANKWFSWRVLNFLKSADGSFDSISRQNFVWSPPIYIYIYIYIYEMHGGKARMELHKTATCCLKQFLVATSYKALVRPFTTIHTSHLIKTEKTSREINGELKTDS